MDIWQLKQRQSLPLEAKVRLTESRIRDWYDQWDGDVYVAFSGGLDSTALLHIVRSLYPHVMFGVHLEKGTNRFQRLAVTHPQLHAYCMENLGMKRVLEHIGVPSE